MTASHHNQNGNLTPLLPCYYQPDFNYFVEKVGNSVPDGAVILVNGFQFKHHEAWNSFEVFTGIPVPTLHEAQAANFDILLNYLTIVYPSHPRNAVLNLFSLVQSSVLAQLNRPSFGNSP